MNFICLDIYAEAALTSPVNTPAAIFLFISMVTSGEFNSPLPVVNCPLSLLIQKLGPGTTLNWNLRTDFFDLLYILSFELQMFTNTSR